MNEPTREQRLEACLNFFASVIKSGEPWTPVCQRQYDAARTLDPPVSPSIAQAVRDIRAQQASPGDAALRQKLGNVLRNFHRNACYPEAEPTEVSVAIDAVLRAALSTAPAPEGYVRGQRDGLRHAAEIAAAAANTATSMFQSSTERDARALYDARARCARAITEAIRAAAAKLPEAK